MKNNFLIPLLFVFCVFHLQQTFAAVTPLSVALAPPIQFPPSDFSITGLRLSLGYGQHRDVYGIDFGLLGNVTDQDFVGIGVAGGFNATHGNTKALGMQFAGLMNLNQGKTSVYGVQLAMISNYNKGESHIYGLQFALANLSQHTKIYGVQAGLYNDAQDVYGFQIGLVNRAKSLHGIQIGLVNFNHTGPFVVSPLINVGF